MVRLSYGRDVTKDGVEMRMILGAIKHTPFLAVVALAIGIFFVQPPNAPAKGGAGASGGTGLMSGGPNSRAGKIRQLRIEAIRAAAEESQSYEDLDNALAGAIAVVHAAQLIISLALPPVSGLTAAQAVAWQVGSNLRSAKTLLRMFDASLDAQ